jgi:hypothetical protein
MHSRPQLKGMQRTEGRNETFRSLKGFLTNRATRQREGKSKQVARTARTAEANLE